MLPFEYLVIIGALLFASIGIVMWLITPPYHTHTSANGFVRKCHLDHN